MWKEIFLIFISAMCFRCLASVECTGFRDEDEKIFSFFFSSFPECCLKYFISHSPPLANIHRKSDIGRVSVFAKKMKLTLRLCKHLEEGENDFFLCVVYFSHLMLNCSLPQHAVQLDAIWSMEIVKNQTSACKSQLIYDVKKWKLFVKKKKS